MFNILITGANGQLGCELRSLANKFENYTYFFTDKNTLNITQSSDVETFIVENDISVIINCAAYTNVDKAEEEKELCRLINTSAVKYLAEIAKKHNVKLIHISTDYVFEGNSNVHYKESDVTNPMNHYGYSKLKGEEALRKVNPKNSLIIRTSWLYSEFGHNFVKTIIRISKEKQEIKVVNDQIGSPTYALDLAEAILKILPTINSKGVEVFHYSNDGECSWFEFAKEIIAISKTNCTVLPIESSEFNSKAYRPKYSLLNTEKFSKTFNLKIPNWKVSLESCLNKL